MFGAGDLAENGPIEAGGGEWMRHGSFPALMRESASGRQAVSGK